MLSLRLSVNIQLIRNSSQVATTYLAYFEIYCSESKFILLHLLFYCIQIIASRIADLGGEIHPWSLSPKTSMFRIKLLYVIVF